MRPGLVNQALTSGTEPLVGLRYFGPDAFPDSVLPNVGDHKKIAAAAAGKKKKK